MNKGFTLLELVIVVVIIAILAAIGIPQYFRTIERARVSEGYGVLGTLRSAQLRYRAQYGVYTATIGDLDVEFTALRYYTATVAATNPIATCTRNTAQNPGYGAYTITITDDGTIAGTIPVYLR